MNSRWMAYLVSLVVVGAVLYPLTWNAQRDSFPLSSYPMFARNRRSPVLNATYAVAFDPDGKRSYVPPALVANREVLQARAVLDLARRGGKEGSARLCESIARRVARRRSGTFGRAREIAIVFGSHDAIEYFDRGTLGKERELARCPVKGR